MCSEKEDQLSEKEYSNSVLKIIYEDANASLKLLHDDINSINTRLTLLIGFNATFASLLPKLPQQTFFFIGYSPCQEFKTLYPYAEPFIKIPIDVLNWLLLITPPIIFLLGTSITLAIWSVLPSPTCIIIFPEKMLEKGKRTNCSEEGFQKAMIINRDETIQELEHIISQKASRLRFALITLGGAALLTVLDILIHAA